MRGKCYPTIVKKYIYIFNSVRKIFERGGGRRFRKFKNKKAQNENFYTQNQSVFRVQSQVKTKKKKEDKVFTQI